MASGSFDLPPDCFVTSMLALSTPRVPGHCTGVPLPGIANRFSTSRMEREFSAGGVLVKLTGVGRCWPRSAPGASPRACGPSRRGTRPGRAARGDRAARGPGGDGRRGQARREARRREVHLHPAGRVRVFKIVSFYLLRAGRGRIGEIEEAMQIEVAEARWLPLDEAPRCSHTAASARWRRRRAIDSPRERPASTSPTTSSGRRGEGRPADLVLLRGRRGRRGHAAGERGRVRPLAAAAADARRRRRGLDRDDGARHGGVDAARASRRSRCSACSMPTASSRPRAPRPPRGRSCAFPRSPRARTRRSPAVGDRAEVAPALRADATGSGRSTTSRRRARAATPRSS